MSTIRKFAVATATAGLLGAAIFTPVQTANADGVEVGKLTCQVEGGRGFVFGSTKQLSCSFVHADPTVAGESYTGEITKFGLDLGKTGKSVIVWGVVARKPKMYTGGSLAGTYKGVSGSASFAVGLGANVLVGGSSDSYALQPLSVSAETGVNVAVGVAALTLR